MPGGLVLVVDVDGVTYGMGLHVCLLSGTRLWSQLIELDLLENDAASAVGGNGKDLLAVPALVDPLFQHSVVHGFLRW